MEGKSRREKMKSKIWDFKELNSSVTSSPSYRIQQNLKKETRWRKRWSLSPILNVVIALIFSPYTPEFHNFIPHRWLHSLICCSLVKRGPAWLLACQMHRLLLWARAERPDTEWPPFVFLKLVEAHGWEAGTMTLEWVLEQMLGREWNVTDAFRKSHQWGFLKCIQEAKRI